jgi:arylsulfatase A-like enzyme
MGKGSTWEGGMRVPGIAWWPGRIAPRVESGMACTMDLFPTFVALAGGEAPRDRTLDGIDISGILLRSEPAPVRPYFFYRELEIFAVRKGPWKAHLVTRSGYGNDESAIHDPPLLFHLDNDPSEKYPIAKGREDVIADLLREVEAHRVGAKPVSSQLRARSRIY